jgi:hypothetical protein
MGSINVQPPSGLRNVTEVFIYLRNNKHQNRAFLNEGFADTRDENFSLISLDENKVTAGSVQPPSWVNVVDEISYELERIQSRKNLLKDFQQKHLKRPDFSDETSAKEQEKIKELTEEVTNIFTHVRRLIRLLQEAETSRRPKLEQLRENVTASFFIYIK